MQHEGERLAEGESEVSGRATMDCLRQRPEVNAPSDPDHGRRRVAIENVQPVVDGGRFPIKRCVGEEVRVSADIFADGHDRLRAVLQYRADDEEHWTEVLLQPQENDRWEAAFRVSHLLPYWYRVEAWVDHFLTWQSHLRKRVDAQQDVAVELVIGSQHVQGAVERARGEDRDRLVQWAGALADCGRGDRVELALSRPVSELMTRYADRSLCTRGGQAWQVCVEREIAGFSAWYELFPRSCSPDPSRPGTLRDCEPWIKRIAQLGFDVLYLPPIHPIGRTARKGANNASVATPEDPGSPWAIGAAEGGHKSVHPELGTLADFRWLVETARRQKVEIALDIAFQCSPDHPYVHEHPQWFRHRPDGTIQYAENPPKKYQDIYPFDFETEDWPALWEELKSVIVFWIEQGVRIFRVDNPHTKPFRFWEWLIGEVKLAYPDTVFLSEAFTRPRVKYRLAKLGFSQSYTYFTWRNTKYELTRYLTHLVHDEVHQYCRPNLWPNTPDILPEYLQYGGRPAFMTRLVLAATLSGNYGVYGLPFEQYEQAPREPGSEEYRDSEKYQVRHWDPRTPGSLDAFMRRLNQIRRENPALRNDTSLQFLPLDNEQIIAYVKMSHDAGRDAQQEIAQLREVSQNLILVVVNLDPYHKQSGWVELPPELIGSDPQRPYQVHDLLGDGRYLWTGSRNYIELDPQVTPGQVFRIRRHVRTEQQFEYYL